MVLTHERASPVPTGWVMVLPSMSPCRMRCHVTHPHFPPAFFLPASQGVLLLTRLSRGSREVGSGGNRSGIVPACLPACRLIASMYVWGTGRGGRGGARVWVGGEERYQGRGGRGTDPPHHRLTRQPAPPRRYHRAPTNLSGGEICTGSFVYFVRPASPALHSV